MSHQKVNIDLRLPTDSDALLELLVELMSHLQPLLPDEEWVKEGTIKSIGDHPGAAGEVANVSVGMKGDHKIAIQQYRLYLASDNLLTYVVGDLGYLSYLSY